MSSDIGSAPGVTTGPLATAPLAADAVRARTVQSIAWRAGNQAILQMSRALVAVVLARLLTPSEYGVAGMVLVLSSFVLPFADLGFGAALVQRPSLTRRDLSTVFWVCIVGGTIFTMLGIALAGPVAAFYGRHQVRALFAVLSLGFLIVSFATVQRSLLVRDLNFRSLELRNLAGTIVGAVLAILTAARGWGPWALIVQFLASAIVTTALLWVGSAWRPRLMFSLASARDLGGFGAKAIGARLLNDVRQNSDKLVVGRVLGSVPLGIYLIANNVILMPFNRVVVPLQDVLFPAFSRIQDGPRRVGAAWLKVNRALAAISLPAMLGLIVVAPDFVPLVLGSRWNAAIPIIQLLAWVGLMQALQGLNGAVLTALDKAGRLFVVSALIVVASLAALFAGLPWGIKGVAIAYAVANTVVFPSYTWYVARSVGTSLGMFVRSLAAPAAASVGLVIAVFFARRGLLDAHVSLGLRFLLEVAAGAAVYTGVIGWFARDLVVELRRFRRPRTPDHIDRIEARLDELKRQIETFGAPDEGM